ncbi:MAG: DegT/DnrJ/EryC1/StrS family aminotransferase [Candidatus Thorarchaeota archaeon]
MRDEINSVPFVDLRADFFKIKAEILETISSIIDDTKFILGKYVLEFEKAFAKYIKTKYAVTLNSGTTALHFALISHGIGKKDEVITVPNSFIASSEAIAYTGAKPVFVDINPSTFNIDTEKIEEKITNKTKAILPVHLYGQPCDLDEISDICSDHNLVLIEDACQAHGAEYKNQRIGSTGNTTCFSFYPTKNLGAFGDAGILVTDDENIAETVRILRDHGQQKKHVHNLLGYNGRMDALQAAILKIKLPYLDKWIEQRIKIAKLYYERLNRNEFIDLPILGRERKHVYHLFVIRSKNREKLQNMLSNYKIATQIHYPTPIHLQQAFKYLGYRYDDFPETEKTCKEILSLPMSPTLSKEQINYVCDKINKFYYENLI